MCTPKYKDNTLKTAKTIDKIWYYLVLTQLKEITRCLSKIENKLTKLEKKVDKHLTLIKLTR